MRLEDLPADTQEQLRVAHGIAKPKPKKSTKQAAELLALQMRARKLRGWVREERFAWESLGRMWRFDFAHRKMRLAVEVEGVVVRRIGDQLVMQGRHATINGFREDCRKYAAAIELGWQVLRFEQSMIESGEAIATIERVLVRRGEACRAAQLSSDA